MTFSTNAQSTVQEKQTTIAFTSDALTTTPDVKITKFVNGLIYYIENNEKPEDKVELRLVIKAGSMVETQDNHNV